MGCGIFSFFGLDGSGSGNGSVDIVGGANLTRASSVCNHVITTYVIPDVLHLAAFCIGLHAERVLRSEQLYALMEKVEL